MYTIATISDMASAVLQNRGKGTVHSVYSKVINIMIDGQLLAIQESGSVMSPITICLDESDSIPRTAEPGSTVIIYGNGIFSIGGSFFFDHSNSKIIPSIISVSKNNDLNYRLFNNCIRMLMPRGGFADLCTENPSLWQKHPAAKAAGEIIKNAADYYISDDIKAASHELIKIVGLGDGLTPSGDDFLCGVMAAAFLTGSKKLLDLQKELKSSLECYYSTTTDISAAFLKAASCGHFSQAVLSLVCCPAPDVVCRSFAAIGHSSGTDTLNGLAYAYKLFEKQTAC